MSSNRAGPDALLNVSAFILASGSPRRALLLGTAGYTFEVIPPEVDETPHVDEQPPEYVLRLSAEKAAAVQAPPGTTVLAADTTVVLDGAPIGKPIDEADALAMLQALNGRTHSVLTGWTILSGIGERFGIAESRVTFTSRTDEELLGYIRRTRPYDKAGAYALQGDDGWLVASVTGSRANVMGLPVGEIVPVLEECGVERSAEHRG